MLYRIVIQTKIVEPAEKGIKRKCKGSARAKAMAKPKAKPKSNAAAAVRDRDGDSGGRTYRRT